jgi:hypothetical protein
MKTPQPTPMAEEPVAIAGRTLKKILKTTWLVTVKPELNYFSALGYGGQAGAS